MPSLCLKRKEEKTSKNKILGMDLEDAFVESARRDLESVVATIIESPGSTHSEAHFGSSLEHCTHTVPAMIIDGVVHEPVRVPPIHIQRLAIQHELRAVPTHEPYLGLPSSEPQGEIHKGGTCKEAQNWYHWAHIASSASSY